MKYLITIQHPAHVHFFKHVIWRLEDRGHEVHVVAREYDVTTKLLEHYDIPYELLAGGVSSLIELPKTQMAYEARVIQRVRRLRPDVVTAIGGLAAAHASVTSATKSVVFTDTPTRSNVLMSPFADVICTPYVFGQDFGSKQVRYDGFHELSYLHPNQFEPDPDRMVEYGVDPDEPYFVLRFTALKGLHDVGQRGLSVSTKEELVETLSDYGEVYVSGVDEHIPASLADRRLPVPPHLLHSFLYYANLFVTDTHTTATEAALLGTPTVRSNTYCGEGDLNNFSELEDEYGLLYSTPDEDEVFSLVEAILNDPESTDRWRRKRDWFLSDTIDVASFVSDSLVRVGRGDGNSDALERLAKSKSNTDVAQIHQS